MEKLQISLATQDLTEKRQEALEKIKESGFFADFIEKNEISDLEIMKNASKFLRVLEANEICKNCQGLSKCQKPNKGIRLDLTFDESGDLTLSLLPCLEQAKLLRINDLFLYRDFPDEYIFYAIEDLISNADFKAVRKNVIAHLVKILKSLETKGLYLTGTRQSGKTFILSVFSKTIAEKNNLKAAFLDCNTRIKELNDLYFIDKNEFNDRLLELMNVDLLVLDDFGNEYKNEIIRDMIVFPLLNERMKKSLLTCFTSSYSLSDVMQMYALRENSSPKAQQLKEIINLMTKQIKLDSLPYRE